MYLFRCCNPNPRYRENRPSACKAADTVKQPEPRRQLYTATGGGVTITSFAGTEKEYDVILLNLELPLHKRTAPLTLNFACNLSSIHLVADIQFQLIKARAGLTVPLAAPVNYRRVLEFTGSDAISFSVCDPVLESECRCCYLIKMHMTGTVPANGMVAVTNPVLTAIYL